MKEKEEKFVRCMVERGIIPILGRITTEKLEIMDICLASFFMRNIRKIFVMIYSSGGDGDVGFEIHDLLKLYPGEVVGIVAGRAMSAATDILQGCDKRYATPNSRILIHNGSHDIKADFLFDDDKLKEFLEEKRRFKDRSFRLLAQATKKSIDEIAAECKRDKPMDVEQAIAFGLLDGVWDKKLPWDPIESTK